MDQTMMNNNAPMPQGDKASGMKGSLIAAIVILAVIIVGALYFWGSNGDSATDEAVESINMQSDSDEAAAIEADLDSTELDSLDSELNEADFNAS